MYDNDVVDLTDRFNDLISEYATTEGNVCDFDGWNAEDLTDLRDVILQAVELLGIE